MRTKKNYRKEENSFTDQEYGGDPLYGGANGLDDYRRDENGLDRMEIPGGEDDDNVQGYPI